MKKGFTIVELVIVVAIIGTLLLVVFTAMDSKVETPKDASVWVAKPETNENK